MQSIQPESLGWFQQEVQYCVTMPMGFLTICSTNATNVHDTVETRLCGTHASDCYTQCRPVANHDRHYISVILHFRLASQRESYIIPQYQIKTAVNNCVEEPPSSIQEAKGVSATKYHPNGHLHQFRIKYAHKNYKSVVCSCHMLIKWCHLWIMCEKKSHRLMECWPHNPPKCSELLAQHSITSHIPCTFSNTVAWTSNLIPRLYLLLAQK